MSTDAIKPDDSTLISAKHFSFNGLGVRRRHLYEGFLSLNSSSSWTIDAGKKTFKWGKGYTWNPVAFIDRPKNPDDPEVGTEGIFARPAD
jgi:hypothetical protein